MVPRKNRSIVTGGAGFIGSWVVKLLLDRGHEVLVIDDLSGGVEENIPVGADFTRIGINDVGINGLFHSWRPDFVFHLAAYAAEGLSHHIPNFNYTNNIVGTTNMLTAAYKSGARHFVFTSSIAVYGELGERAFHEDDRKFPMDPYGIAKLACEQHIDAFCRYYPNMNYTVFRPHNVFGPRQNINDPFRNVVGIFMRQAMNNEALTIFGDGEQTREFSPILPVAKPIVDCIDMPLNTHGRTFNVGGDEIITVKALAGKVLDIVNPQMRTVNFLEPRHEAKHAHANHERVRSVFNIPSVSIDEGLREMYEHVVSQKRNNIPTLCPSPVEIWDNMPEKWKGIAR